MNDFFDILGAFALKGMAGLIFLISISLLPFHDEWEFSINPNCADKKAQECKQIFLECDSLMRSIDYRSGTTKFDPARTAARQKCLSDSYDPICKVA